MANFPKISIITVVFNGEKDIQQCILSVASQRYPNKEHLIVDGLSTDKTMEIVRRYADQYPHIRWISEKDNGIYDAMNKGLDLAIGEWIYFLGSDDVFHDADVLNTVFNDSQIDDYEVVYGNVLWGDTGTIYDGKFTLLKLMYKNICQQALLLKKSLFAKMGKFDTKYTLLADHVFNMKWFNDESVKHNYIDLVFCNYCITGSSTTTIDKAFKENRELLIRTYFPPEYAESFVTNANLTYEAGANRHTIQVQEEKIAELDSAMEGQSRVVELLNQQVVNLKGQINDRDKAIADLHNSISWRLTAPLRSMHARLTGGHVEPPKMPLLGDGVHQRDHSATGDIRDHIRQLASLKLSQFLEVQSARLTFPPVSDMPKISVLLILFNKAEYTYQCLETLLANRGVSYEVILVDNCSSDSTDELLKRLTNVTVIKNLENVGFLKACNQAAGVAKGQWLLFLNNDTQVSPALLDVLYDTAEATELCGAVGAKLIFPDGKLQEAGSIIWSDGSCYGYGRDDDPDKAEYSFVREVDYCSGACLLVRRDLFEEAGKFDERYAPAYYEEVDLCMAVRHLGYKVIYQPAAKVIHYEFGSAGKKQDSIDLQISNKRKFVEKWREQLSNHVAPGKDNLLAGIGRYSSRDQRILVVDDRVPDPALGSGFPRTFELLKALRKLGYSVTYYPLQIPERVEPVTHQLQQMGVDVLYGTGLNRFASFYRAHKNFFSKIWLSRPHNMECIGELIKSVNPSQTVIYDAEALFSMREITKKELDGEMLSDEDKLKIISREVELVKYADKIVTVSARERTLISAFRADDVHVVSHVCEVNPTEREFDERKDILFVGGFLTSPSPNEDSMLYFAREIFPEVHKQTGARLWIVGTNVLESIHALASENTIVTGRVDDLREYYDNCRVFIAPTRYAAGIPLKLVEALSYGIPAVVTPVIAEQLGGRENVVLIGKDAGDFARQVVSCYRDRELWGRLRDESLRMIAEDFSENKFINDVREALK